MGGSLDFGILAKPEESTTPETHPVMNADVQSGVPPKENLIGPHIDDEIAVNGYTEQLLKLAVPQAEAKESMAQKDTVGYSSRAVKSNGLGKKGSGPPPKGALPPVKGKGKGPPPPKGEV